MPCIILNADISGLTDALQFMEENTPEAYNDCRAKVRLALEEIFINIVNYAYIDPDSLARLPEEAQKMHNKVQFEIGITPINNEPLLHLIISDWGRPYNPFTESPVPDISLDVEDRPIGGLGLFLVKNLATQYSYRHQNSSNIVELFFSATLKS